MYNPGMIPHQILLAVPIPREICMITRAKCIKIQEEKPMKTADFMPRFPIADARAKLDGPAQNVIQCTKGGDTMPAASKKNAYNMKYDKENMRQIKFNLSLKYDQDVIAALDAVPNKQGYIKALIRADIARAKTEAEATGPAQKEED